MYLYVLRVKGWAGSLSSLGAMVVWAGGLEYALSGEVWVNLLNSLGLTARHNIAYVNIINMYSERI